MTSPSLDRPLRSEADQRIRDAASDLLAALEEIAKPDGLTEASAGTMVFEDLTSKKQIARAAIVKARAT